MAPDTHRMTQSASRSRAVAVQHVANGTSVAVLGAAAFGVGTLMPLTLTSYLSLVVGGIGLVGVGAFTAARAYRHLKRFGRPGSSRWLATLGGFGLSSFTMAATHGLLVVGFEPIVRALHNVSLAGVAGFGALLAMLTLRALVGWMTGSGEGCE